VLYLDKKDEYISELLENIQEIADIIAMELPLRYQDKWLGRAIENGLYTLEYE